MRVGGRVGPFFVSRRVTGSGCLVGVLMVVALGVVALVAVAVTDPRVRVGPGPGWAGLIALVGVLAFLGAVLALSLWLGRRGARPGVDPDDE